MLKTAYTKLSIKSRVAEHQFIPYGILAFFGFYGFYFFNMAFLESVDVSVYENAYLRGVAGALSLLLICKNYWPIKLRPALPLVWYITLTYNIPFFFTFMFLKNAAIPIWHLYCMSALTFLMLLVDWFSFAVIAVLGITLGASAYIFTTPNPQLPDNFTSIAVTYLTVICYGTLFSQKNDAFQKERLRTTKLLAGAIAHELRTPLSAIGLGMQTLSRLWPFYRDAYAQAVDAQLPVTQLTPQQQQDFDELPEDLCALTQNAHTAINMLLTNVSESKRSQPTELCSMAYCVDEALKSYPFTLHERSRVHWGDEASRSVQGVVQGFWFTGNHELMKHVLFNLLKNALYATAKKGEIFITLEPAGVQPPSVIAREAKQSRNNGSDLSFLDFHGPKRNLAMTDGGLAIPDKPTGYTCWNTCEGRVGDKHGRLIFKDTGKGIARKDLPYVFDHFYTRTKHGTGIGLAFCQSVIHDLGGTIICESVEGEHTTFVLSLPMAVTVVC